MNAATAQNARENAVLEGYVIHDVCAEIWTIGWVGNSSAGLPKRDGATLAPRQNADTSSRVPIWRRSRYRDGA